jgi:hypothetical protein
MSDFAAVAKIAIFTDEMLEAVQSGELEAGRRGLHGLPCPDRSAPGVSSYCDRRNALAALGDHAALRPALVVRFRLR